MNEKYKDIINMPHHVSKSFAPMSKMDRAAQFAPYSALSGYEDAVEETARLTDSPIELDEYEKERINATLSELLTTSPDTIVEVTYFRPDKIKNGGAYITLKGLFGIINEYTSEITVANRPPIKIDDIIELKIILN